MRVTVDLLRILFSGVDTGTYKGADKTPMLTLILTVLEPAETDATQIVTGRTLDLEDLDLEELELNPKII